MRNYGDQKWLGWLDNMRELHRPLSSSYRMKPARHGFAGRDTLQKLYADLFFHCRVYATFRESCSRVCVLAPRAIAVGIGSSRTGAFRRADPPKVDRPNTLARSSPKASGRFLQRAADGRGNGAKARDELSENLWCKRLVAVALGDLRRIVHFNHERVCARSDCGQAHLWNKFSQAESVRWIDDDRQMRLSL